jgi:hypothetical protein
MFLNGFANSVALDTADENSVIDFPIGIRLALLPVAQYMLSTLDEIGNIQQGDQDKALFEAPSGFDKEKGHR